MCGIAAVIYGGAEVAVDTGFQSVSRRGPDGSRNVRVEIRQDLSMELCASVLGLRGSQVVSQPLEDAGGNILLFNGEIFDGPGFIEVGNNDTVYMSKLLGQVSSEQEMAKTLGEKVHGPWAIIYYQRQTRRLYFGRDRIGRRSLLVSSVGKRFHISSVVPDGELDSSKWQEVNTDGLYRIDLEETEKVFGPPTLIPWNPVPGQFVNEMIAEYSAEDLVESASKVLNALSASVQVRVTHNNGSPIGILFSGGLDCAILAALVHRHASLNQPIDLFNVCFKETRDSPDRQTAISTWHELRQAFPDRTWNLVCVNKTHQDVLNIENHVFSLVLPKTTHMDFNIGCALWFAASRTGQLYQTNVAERPRLSVDSANLLDILLEKRAPKAELKQVKPPPMATGAKCDTENCDRVAKPKCVTRCCAVCCKRKQTSGEIERCPCHKIAKDVRKAKRRRERELKENEGELKQDEDTLNVGKEEEAKLYISPARILFSGLGADEHFGGYGRHKVAHKKNGWTAVCNEIKLDIGRLWYRNLGRDDRCISDNGVEVRHPYLDENLRQVLQTIPINHIINPALPKGLGDKRLLRIICLQLGLPKACSFEKRAIQFGTRIAQHSRSKAEGSNRSFKGDTTYKLLSSESC